MLLTYIYIYIFFFWWYGFKCYISLKYFKTATKKIKSTPFLFTEIRIFQNFIDIENLQNHHNFFQNNKSYKKKIVMIIQPVWMIQQDFSLYRIYSRMLLILVLSFTLYGPFSLTEYNFCWTVLWKKLLSDLKKLFFTWKLRSKIKPCNRDFFFVHLSFYPPKYP